MAFVSAMDVAVGNFLLSAGIFPSTPIGVTSVAPPSSIVVRPGVAGFITGDHVHGLSGLRLLVLLWLWSVAIARPLLIHLFDPPALSCICDAILLHNLKEPVQGLRPVVLKVLSARAET
jgi:hypothetical protein